MNVPVQVKIPAELAVELRAKLDVLHAKHAEEVKRAQRADGPRLAALLARGRRLTIHHLVRVIIMAGRDALLQSDNTLLRLLAEDPVVAGRPRGSRAI